MPVNNLHAVYKESHLSGIAPVQAIFWTHKQKINWYNILFRPIYRFQLLCSYSASWELEFAYSVACILKIPAKSNFWVTLPQNTPKNEADF